MGYSNKKIRTLSYNTRFYHDMGFMGDTAEEWAEDLLEDNVDMSSFVFDDFFPPEFPPIRLWKRILMFLCPLLPESFYVNKAQYKPLTLKMIDRVLEAKDWSVILDSN